MTAIYSSVVIFRRSVKDKFLFLSGCDIEEVFLGFELEGSDLNFFFFYENMENSLTFLFMRWVENFIYLLDDRDGLFLFITFLD